MSDTWLISIGTAIAVALLGGMKILWDKMNAKDIEHKQEREQWLSKFDVLVTKQNETIKHIAEKHDEALDELSEKYDKRQGEINDTMLAAFRQAFGKKNNN